MTKILIIDDEDLFREDFATLLRHYGYCCNTASNAKDGVSSAKKLFPDIIFCDIVMPDKSGIEILDELITSCPECSIIIITAYGKLETAVEAFRKGAVDYILKPIVKEVVLQKLNNLVSHKSLNQEVKYLRRMLSQEQGKDTMVGESQAMRKVMELVQNVASSNSTVLIRGESGTGKELVAREIYANSENRENPFIAINCASIPEQLLESELFGHVRGAFTDAVSDRKGYFELAGNGTILLDEIGDMPINLQGKLLRVLEEKEFVRVGDTELLRLNARILASTNKQLRELVESGVFRDDLYYRLNVIEIYVPSLKERRDDIPLLVDHFVKKYNSELKRQCVGLDNEAMSIFLSYAWPGNIRQLRNVIERAMILNRDNEYISISDLSDELTGNYSSMKAGENLKDAVKVFETEYIRRVLTACNGNKEEAARRLGINPSTLYRKMPELSVSGN